MIIYEKNRIYDLSKAEEIAVYSQNITIQYPQGIATIEISIEKEETRTLAKFIAENLHKPIAMDIATLLSLALGKKDKKTNKK